MLFVETSLFTAQLARYLSDDEYRELQAHLMAHPDTGALIRGSGGIRKVRGGEGKRAACESSTTGWQRRRRSIC
jgi:hypothetical protein